VSRLDREFDISVKADKKRRSRRKGTGGAFTDSSRECDWPECKTKGVHRAPASPQDLNSFRWFCADHIKEYNKRWDFYKGMSADEIDEARRADQSWDRPTWKMEGKPSKPQGSHKISHAEGRSWERFGFSDPLEVLGENATINPGAAQAEEARKARRRLLPRADIKALEALDLDETATATTVRERYSALVKQLHPDMNGGDRSEEARLRGVITAWHHLKKSAAFRQ